MEIGRRSVDMHDTVRAISRVVQRVDASIWSRRVRFNRVSSSISNGCSPW